MPTKPLLVIPILISLIAITDKSATADPCGMVPPIYPGQQVPITRIGLQQTYVFYKDGVETFVIRPGFSGKVEEFGMLIPFPTPPAIRKVPDHIFPHLANAVDPPEVVVDLRHRFLPKAARAFDRARRDFKADDGLKLEKKKVRVLREEAVGMYEVAVLEAGSSEALKKWMDEHGYKYPKGMDRACDDYVELRWCFVAVKTKVGEKKGVDPKPGQRKVEAKLPSGATFDGHVQGMGFRFKVENLVVPMRLSAFNKGELRNVVYLLTEGPRKIRAIPEEYVMRQISGEQLIKNVTEPLPLRIIGGTEADIPEYRRRTLKQERDPTPKNGAARELFASDLLAATSGKLSLPHEEREKELLRIGERFGLRGGEIDKLNAQALAEARRKTVEKSLGELKKMTLTVVDGDFPRELLAKQNLTFAEYRMPSKRNKSQLYDAKLNGPAPKKQGVLKTGALLPLKSDEALSSRDGSGKLPAINDVKSNDTGASSAAAENAAKPFGKSKLAWVLSAFALAMIGLVVAARFKTSRAVTRSLVIFSVAISVMASAALAQDKADDKKADEKKSDKKADEDKRPIRELLRDLNDAGKAAAAVDALVARGAEAKEQLKGEAIEGNDLARRGWAIVALAEIGGDDVDQLLAKVHGDSKQPALLRTWAAAARVYMTESTDELIEKASLVSTFPALGRPLGMRIIERLSDKEQQASPEGILAVSLKVPKLQQALVPAILALGPEKLSGVLTTAKDQTVRRQAAAYLGTLAQQGDKGVAPAVIKVYKFDAQAKDVPWSGGPLFVPGIAWQKDDARALVGNLIRWHLWCDRKGRKAEQKQIHNNLRSVGLARVAGYQSPGFREATTVQWLTTWGKAIGRKALADLLAEQGAADTPKYSNILEKL